MQDEEVCSIASAMIKTISSYKIGLKIVHLNAQSLLKKIDEFRFLFTQSNVDVICVSETWFVNDLCDSSIICEGFNRIYTLNPNFLAFTVSKSHAINYSNRTIH